MKVDARVPVVFGALSDAAPDDAVLLEAASLPPACVGLAFQVTGGAAAAFGHPAGCACCVPRAALAREIGGLFAARAKSDVAFFRRVVAVPESEAGRAALVRALTEDPVCMSRFRIA